MVEWRNKPGFFVTFEGPEGSGKSTLVKRLAENLPGRTTNLLSVKEPGGTDIGMQIRGVVLDIGNAAMKPETEFLLFSASRAQLVREVIRPALRNGYLVLCDRYADSSLAYQGYGKGLDMETLKKITGFATGGLRPDWTVFLDIDAETGLGRKQTNGGDWNRLDAESLDFHRKVRRGFWRLMDQDPERWERWGVVNAGRPAEDVFKEVEELLLARLTAVGYLGT